MLWDSQQVHLSGCCTLSSLAGLSSFNTWRLQQYYILIYKLIFGTLPSYLCSKFTAVQITDNLTANSWQWFKVPLMRSELGKKTLSYCGSWNDLQVRFWMGSFIPFSGFKLSLSRLLVTSGPSDTECGSCVPCLVFLVLFHWVFFHIN